MNSNLAGFAIALSRAIGMITLVSMLGAASIALAAEAKQKIYATPEEAVKELIASMKSGDAKAMMAILGPGSKAIVQSGDAVADKAGRERFVKSYEEANQLEKSGDSKVVLSTGKDNWPFPIPIVKGAAGWRFDAKQGREEILNRRIGRNELAAMQAMLAYVDAQREYYLRNPQNDKLLHYAQKIHQHPGQARRPLFPHQSRRKTESIGPSVRKRQGQGL